MTVKEALKERIDQMTEEEAADLLAYLESEEDEEELTPEEWEEVRRSREEYERGEYVDGEELFRELGL